MTRPSRALALLGVAIATVTATSCSSGPPSVGARLGSPVSIALFTGITRKNPGLHDYFAVVSSRTNEIIVIDPSDDQPVLGPAVVFPLSIPTDAAPLRVAAAALGDRASGGADLLFAVSAGGLELQVVETWTAANRVVPSASVALAPIVGDGAILAIAAETAPSATAAAPRARALVSVTGGRLIIVDFTRDPQTGAVVPQQPVVKSIGIDALAIALEPGGTRAFMATRDPVGGSGASSIHGIAFVDTAVDLAAPWPVTAIDAKAPTVALAVTHVAERVVDPTNPSAPDTFRPIPALRIYAALDQSGCGADRAIDCGIVTLDDQGLVSDPAGELPYRAPLHVTAGIPTAIAVGFPPASGAGRITNDPINPGLPMMTVQPGARDTTAIGVVTSSDGRAYAFDLGRYSPVNAFIATLTGDARLAATNVVSILADDVGIVESPNFGRTTQLGLFSDFPVAPAGGAAPAVVTDPARLPSLVQLTPGYTTADQWFLTWQGMLPAIAQQRGVVGRAATGEIYVAIQANTGTAAQPVWVVGVQVGSPDVGVHGGDVVGVVPDDATVCPPGPDAAHPFPEPRVATDVPVLPADPARFPGGAIKLASGSCFEAGLAPGQVVTATISVRAAGLVLTSNHLGYLGRPTLNQPFVLQYKDETTLSGEALVIARKVRRQFYPLDAPCPAGAPGQPPVAGCYAGYPWLADPLARGPALAFRAGLVRPDLPAGAPAPDPSDPAVLQTIARDTRIIFQTQAGMSPVAFRPTSGGILPSTAISYDRTAFTGHENDATRFYAVYLDDQMINFSPSVSGGDITSLR